MIQRKRNSKKKSKNNQGSQSSRNNQVSHNNRKHRYRFVVVLVIALAFLGIFLPGWLLMWQSEDKMNMVDAVPVEYYSPANLAVARNASANMGIYQKLQLITGRWESNSSQPDAYERELENYEAVELAKQQLDVLYQKGLYPVTLLSDYGNWYSWETAYRKVIDSTFHTYAAYYWEIQFEKYDGTEKHHLYMLEDGTIFLAQAWEPESMDVSAIFKISDISIDSSLVEKGIVKQRNFETSMGLTEYLAFTDVETADLQCLDRSQFRVGEQEYHVLQAYSVNRYLFSVQPAN